MDIGGWETFLSDIEESGKKAQQAVERKNEHNQKYVFGFQKLRMGKKERFRPHTGSRAKVTV